ncbi:MAG: Na(+)-translocating NADH-quinone reductase subunit C [Spirochaetes bacterium ADurb.Bin215]|nr:MAG: Na(+)-translocating NADH-quinone reductase subunit C [Spirochaetes bacterium ADurb.Bin215]
MKKVLTIVLVFALSFGFLTIVNNMGNTDTASEQQTLTGTAEGFGGDINVTVVVNGEDIISVEVTADGETQGIGSMAVDELPALIVEADSAEVEGVSGATYTSDGIKAAVRNALSSKQGSEEEVTLTGTAEGFGGDVTVNVVVKGDDIISVEAIGEDETEGIGSVALVELPALIAEADSTDIDGVSGATYTSDGIKAAVRNALESRQ